MLKTVGPVLDFCQLDYVYTPLRVDVLGRNGYLILPCFQWWSNVDQKNKEVSFIILNERKGQTVSE